MFIAPSKSRYRAKILIIGVSKTSHHIKIKIKMPNPSQKLLASSKSQNEDLEDSNVCCTFKIKRKRVKIWIMGVSVQWPHLNKNQDAKPQSGNFSILQSSKWEFKEHGCSLHQQNQNEQPKFGSLVYHTPVTISKSRLRCQTPVKNLQHLPKPQMKTYRTWMFFAPSKSS